MSSASELDSDMLGQVNNHDDCHVISQTCLSPRFMYNYSEPSKSSTRKIGSLYNRRILRSGRNARQVIKPLNSLQSCLMSQLYREHAEMEEYMLVSGPSPDRPTVRQLLVTDGSRINCRASSQTDNVQTRIRNKKDNEGSSEEKASVIGVPPLPNVGRDSVMKTRKDRGQRLSSSSNVIGAVSSDVQVSLGAGPSHEANLFSLGIAIGIMSSLMSSRREIDRLNGLLKQTEDLVQELKEKLDMKYALPVTEMIIKGCESQHIHEETVSKEAEVVAFSYEQKFGQSTKGHHEDCNQGAQEESMRKIEAELEAELAMLELNMISSTLDAQFSNQFEVDEECGPKIARGELKANMFNGQLGDENAGRDESGNSTPHLINYSVSPIELSLRLHEVIESRLEERVEELETALQNSVRKTRYLESKHAKSLIQFSNAEAGSLFAQYSSTATEEDTTYDAAVMYLADDALHAYNETYDEFTIVNGSEEECLESRVENSQESLCLFDQNLDCIGDSWVNNYLPCHSDTNMKTSTIVHNSAENEILPNKIDNDDRNIDYDNIDEIEKLLIQQILEKSRQGSPAVLNARRLLFSLDQN